MTMMKRGLSGLLVLAGLLIGLLAGQLMVSGTVHAEDQVPREVMEQLLNRIENGDYTHFLKPTNARIDGDTVLVLFKGDNHGPAAAVTSVVYHGCPEWWENHSEYKTIVFTAIFMGSDGVVTESRDVNWTSCTLHKKLDKYWNLVDQEKVDDAKKLMFFEFFQDKSLLNRLGKEQLTLFFAILVSGQSTDIPFASYRIFDVEVIDQKLHLYMGWVAPGPYDDEPFKANGDIHPYVAQEIKKHQATPYCGDKAMYRPVIDFGVEFVFHFYADGKKTSFAVDRETCADLMTANDFDRPEPTYSWELESIVARGIWEGDRRKTEASLAGVESQITSEMLNRGLTVAKNIMIDSEIRVVPVNAEIDNTRIVLNLLGSEKRHKDTRIIVDDAICYEWVTKASDDKYLSFEVNTYLVDGKSQSRHMVNWTSCYLRQRLLELEDSLGDDLEKVIAYIEPPRIDVLRDALDLRQIRVALALTEMYTAIFAPSEPIRVADVRIVDDVIHVYQGENLAVMLADGRAQEFEPYSEEDAERIASIRMGAMCGKKETPPLFERGVAYRFHHYQDGHQTTFDINKDTCREYWDS